ncbi:MAG: pyrroline-5-carboxylate reductase [Planctomycetaceae bacterium]
MTQRIGFLGAGKMATAFAMGLSSSGYVQTADMFASDVSEQARAAFQEKTGVTTVSDNAQLLAQADIIFVAIKPQVAHDVLIDLRESVEERHLFISIMAGVPLSRLQTLIGLHTRIVRVMPNTPVLVDAGAAAYSLGSEATPEDGATVRHMLETVGMALEVPESQLDVVTGLSGSGPAYVFQMIEALSDGAVRMGLPREAATRLAAQTLLGAAKMVLAGNHHPGALKDMVTSPGGTTIAGLHEMERAGIRAGLMNAVEAATLRSIELGCDE